jgi:hypothetical protein
MNFLSFPGTETPNFKPPLANFDLDEAVTPAVSTGTTGKGETKKKTKKGR